MITKLFTLLAISIFQISAWAQDHAHHAKHNMALYGNESGIYLSHLVYKSPHNYQVILKVNLPQRYAKLYSQLEEHPEDLFLMVLDPMEIANIQSKPILTGPIIRNGKDGALTVYDHAQILPQDYSIIYFAELPLNLGASSHKANFQTLKGPSCWWDKALTCPEIVPAKGRECRRHPKLGWECF